MTKKETKKAIALDQEYYKQGNTLYLNIIDDHIVTIKKCMKHYRWMQYYFYRKNKIMEYLHARFMNHYGNKVGIYIGRECLEQGITIYHQGITINGAARLGEGCKLHGNNCIGNKGAGGENKAPIIGKNVDIGFGAVIIGDVKIADNCVIGANAVVTKSFLEPGTVICGVPAREIKKK